MISSRVNKKFMHTIEKIGGISMSDYSSVRDNIIKNHENKLYGRVFVVSAYGGVTDKLLAWRLWAVCQRNGR